MPTAHTVQGLRRLVSAWHRAGRSIVTLFVNPKQFNGAADLARYPRTEEDDRGKLVPCGIDLLFAPPPEVMYPAGFATNISITGGLCGADRPGISTAWRLSSPSC